MVALGSEPKLLSGIEYIGANSGGNKKTFPVRMRLYINGRIGYNDY